jgi:hypothetical protein
VIRAQDEGTREFRIDGPPHSLLLRLLVSAGRMREIRAMLASVPVTEWKLPLDS